MTLHRSLIFLFFFLALTINNFAQVPAPTVPNFIFYKLDGTPFSKNNLSKVTKNIIVFFDVTCSHCQKEIEGIGKNYKEFNGVSFYMVSLDESEAIKKFMSSYGRHLYNKRNVNLLQDKDKMFIPLFAPTKYPAVFLYSPQGTLIQYFGGETKVKDLIKAIK
jgi:cytochrome oxidase Cu insertion factor (SCO1/SenC/PrrC family)